MVLNTFSLKAMVFSTMAAFNIARSVHCMNMGAQLAKCTVLG